MAGLPSLDSSLHGKIASCLPEVDQSSFRQVSQDCHRKLETEERWAEKCRSVYPAFEKSPDVSWREHYITLYKYNKPYYVRLLRKEDKGEALWLLQ